ncbi:hypothetical protein THMIRHAM_10310 [Thiomicrorhabdus immobilis]|uniref:Uncharacterized protein n=1 Tax=Thiomicrorhabdus immobilis TaxID=2791037 RepID=A0ABN6CW45_9GAMM|nr:hypothetical protein [Thiomicrorhabdus immobilis]BCN93246.1 hypothetical protein THMIRHAM_10310 [Thiomicrorhabdus immobilis]
MEQCTNPDCKKKYWLSRISDSVYGKDYEDIICPYCNTLVRTMDTSACFMTRKAEELYEGKIGIASENKLIATLTKFEKSSNLEIDTYWYDEVDSEGKVVAKYILKDSSSISPVRENNITFEKIG